MPGLTVRLQGDLAAARKRQDKAITLLLGTVLSDIKNRRIELKRDPSDDEVIEVLRRGIRQRRESVEMYEKAQRNDLADKEKSEISALEVYLPAQVNPQELRDAVRAAIAGGAASIGAVMAAVMPRFKGRAEGGTINAIAREELGTQG